MLARARNRLSYANVMATIAVFLALGGGAYAAATVGSRQVVNNSLKTADLQDNAAVKSADVVDDTVAGGGLSGRDVKEGTLGPVPRAQAAQTAANADRLDGKSSADFASSNPGAWKEVGGPGAPPFNFFEQASCRWGNISAEWNSVAFRRDPFGVVRLKGRAAATEEEGEPCTMVDDRIFQLPAGYRPARREVQAAISGGSDPASVHIKADGWIVKEGATTSFQGVSLDGITFPCGPTGENGCP